MNIHQRELLLYLLKQFLCPGNTCSQRENILVPQMCFRDRASAQQRGTDRNVHVVKFSRDSNPKIVFLLIFLNRSFNS